MRRVLLLLAVVAALLSAVSSSVAGTATTKSLSLDVALPDAGYQRFLDLEVRVRAAEGMPQWLTVAAGNSARLPADIRAGAAVTRPVVRDGFATMHVLVAINNVAQDGPAAATVREQPTSLDLIVTAAGMKFSASAPAIRSCAPKVGYRIWYYVRFEHRPASPKLIFSNSERDARAAGRC